MRPFLKASHFDAMAKRLGEEVCVESGDRKFRVMAICGQVDQRQAMGNGLELGTPYAEFRDVIPSLADGDPVTTASHGYTIKSFRRDVDAGTVVCGLWKRRAL